MLVLTRKRSEVIRIGDDVVIKVIKTGSGTVKLGIEAPANIRVLRGELCEEEVVPEADATEEDIEPHGSVELKPLYLIEATALSRTA